MRIAGYATLLGIVVDMATLGMSVSEGENIPGGNRGTFQQGVDQEEFREREEYMVGAIHGISTGHTIALLIHTLIHRLEFSSILYYLLSLLARLEASLTVMPTVSLIAFTFLYIAAC